MRPVLCLPALAADLVHRTALNTIAARGIVSKLAPESAVEKLRRMRGAAIEPFVLAAILINTQPIWPMGPSREVRHDDGDMARPRDHRVDYV